MAGLHHLRSVPPPLRRILQFSLPRSFGTYASGPAAAQPQLDPDYYYLDEDGQDDESTILRCGEPGSVKKLDTGGSDPVRGVQWVLIGSPSARKHVYAEKLSKLLEVPHISLGSLVRQDLSPRSLIYNSVKSLEVLRRANAHLKIDDNAAFYEFVIVLESNYKARFSGVMKFFRQIADAVNQGTLVPEKIIFALLSMRLEKGRSRGETGFILNGIPRTKIQAEILDQLVDIDLVLNFKCVEDCCLEHTLFENSASCKKGNWTQKIHAYSKQIKQLEDYYEKKRKLLDVQVESTHWETWQGLLVALGFQPSPVQG